MSPRIDDVTDNRDEHRFELTDDGHLAELVYRLEGDRITLVHTGVPDELGGQGIGSVLVAAALERARRDGLTIVPRCPFARGWLERHPDDVDGVAVDWGAGAT
ncbi:MAG: GNAT family N-acetyltransferase [Actinomycetota bacterium]|nr:GNAT family N-acetyltransferase [Actinomycetota bacterium]